MTFLNLFSVKGNYLKINALFLIEVSMKIVYLHLLCLLNDNMHGCIVNSSGIFFTTCSLTIDYTDNATCLFLNLTAGG